MLPNGTEISCLRCGFICFDMVGADDFVSSNTIRSMRVHAKGNFVNRIYGQIESQQIDEVQPNYSLSFLFTKQRNLTEKPRSDRIYSFNTNKNIGE